VGVVEPDGRIVRHPDHQAQALDGSSTQPAQHGGEQKGSRTFAARGGFNSQRDQFRGRYRGSPPNAGEDIPANVPAGLYEEKQVPAFVEIFCKQVAIVCIGAKTGIFDFQDPVQIGRPDASGSISAKHSVILYFGPFGRIEIPLGSKKSKKKRTALDKHFGLAHTEIEMQLSVNCDQPASLPATLVDLRRGDAAILDRIDLPGDDARRLMELGFLPGMRVTAGHSAPGGDPRVFEVDGSQIALRRETARRMKVRLEKAAHLKKTPRA
jgi:ferrous iron transport protein A